MATFYQTRNEKYLHKTTVNICYPSHIHKEIEIFRVIKGQVKLGIEDTDYLLHEGDLSICFPNQPHYIFSVGETLAQLYILSAECVPLYEAELTNFHPAQSVITDLRIPCEVTTLLSMLDRISVTQDLRLIQSYLLTIIGTLLPQLQLEKNSTSYQNSLALLLHYVQLHFTEPISLAGISKEFGISACYISHLFSNKLHISFTGYINQLRVEYASQLLKKHELTVTEICYQSGFNSTRTFFRVFKQIMHMSPHQYRKSY